MESSCPGCVAMATRLILITTVLISHAAARHLAIYPGGTQIKPLGAGTILSCKIEALSDPDSARLGAKPIMFWKAPDGSMISSHNGRVHVERDSWDQYRLYISDVRAEDAGLYSCEGVVEGATLRADTRLEIYDAIQFRDTVSEVKAQVGESPLLECTATGTPQPEISWRFNRRPIVSDDIRYKIEARGLRIYSLQREDAGFYECRAEVVSQGNLKVKAISLDVTYKPVVSYRMPEKTNVIMGHTKEMRCQGIGNPDIKYEWFKEHQASQFAKIKVKLNSEADTYYLDAVSKEDGGRYFCKMSNELGSEEVYTDVTVLVAPVVDEIPAQNPLENNVLFLSCHVTGDPAPVVEWERVGGGQPFVEGLQPDDPRVTVDNSRPGISKLIIHEIKREYTGQYKCTAYNIAGSASKTTNVSVDFIPTINTTDTQKYGWPGETRNFSCTGYGKPLPTLNWLREGQYISDSETYKVYTTKGKAVMSTLQITIQPDQPWIFGSYSCIAKNKYNYIRETVQLVEATVPSMVGNVTVQEDSPTSVILKASPAKDDGGLPLTSWRVEYRPAKTEDAHEKQMTLLFFGKDDVLSVKDLDPGTVYTFYLAVGNAVGFSEPVKFLVETPVQKEQADLPIAGIDDTAIHRTGSSAKESQKYNGKMKEVQSNDANSPGIIGGSLTMIIGIVVVGVVVLLLAGIGLGLFLRRRNRKQENDYTKTWKGMFGQSGKFGLSDHDGTMVKISESNDIDQIRLEMRPIADSIPPDIISQASPKPTHVDKCRSPFEIRKHGSVPKLGSPHTQGSICSNPDTLQQRAWDQMLIKQAMQEEEPVEPEAPKPDELTPMVDLPPPPSFLLDNNEIQIPNQEDNISYHDILDGYHSEENIDEGDKFEIRVDQAKKGVNNC